MGENETEDGTDEIVYPAWHNAVAGGVAGAGARMITAPLDLIRIRRQLTPRTAYPHESVWQTWRNIVKTEGGVTALFRGNVPAIYLWVGYAAVQFALYNRTRDFLGTKEDHPTLTAFVAGATAGLCATVATYPFDVCRTTFAARGLEQQQERHVPFSSLVEPHYNQAGMKRLQPVNAPPKTLLEFAGQLYRQTGIRGFYAGCGPAVIQIIPYMGINFAIYDYLTHGDTRVTLSGYAGSISGAISKIIIYPVDTVKRRLQAQAFFDSSSRPYKSMWDCIRSIARDESWVSFYRGVTPSVLKTTISSGLSFAFFRFTKNLLEEIHDAGFLEASASNTLERRRTTERN